MWVPDAYAVRPRRIAAHTTLERVCQWVGRGEPLVTVGVGVEPTDPIVTVEQAADVQLLDGTSGLSVAANKVQSHLVVELGQPFEAGQEIGRRGGLFKRTLTSPVAGALLFVDDKGMLLIRTRPPSQSRLALLRGMVTVVASQSIEIFAQGAHIQGAWGNGREGLGVVRLMVAQASDSAAPTTIGAGARGSVLVMGATINRAVLERAQAARVGGLIAASMEADSLELAQSLEFPLILLEGFGSLPLNSAAFELLRELDGREAALLGQVAAGVPPEILIPRGGAAVSVPDAPNLVEGERVRVVGAPYHGLLGTVVESRGQRRRLASNLVAPTCTIKLDEGRTIYVPYVNLERLVL